MKRFENILSNQLISVIGYIAINILWNRHFGFSYYYGALKFLIFLANIIFLICILIDYYEIKIKNKYYIYLKCLPCILMIIEVLLKIDFKNIYSVAISIAANICSLVECAIFVFINITFLSYKKTKWKYCIKYISIISVASIAYCIIYIIFHEDKKFIVIYIFEIIPWIIIIFSIYMKNGIENELIMISILILVIRSFYNNLFSSTFLFGIKAWDLLVESILFDISKAFSMHYIMTIVNQEMKKFKTLT